MHVHRPKPLHGWRDILTEIGVIVVGIAIALGGEQVLEALHWSHMVHVGETALKPAYAREVDNVAVREAQSACISGRLAFLSKTLQAASDSGRLPPIGEIGHPPYTPWTLADWDALVASQTVSHLPRGKMATYTVIAQQTAFLSGLSDQEEDLWASLDSMAGPGRRLSDAEAAQLRVTLSRAVNADRRMQHTSELMRNFVKTSGLVEASAFADAERRAQAGKASAAICHPM